MNTAERSGAWQHGHIEPPPPSEPAGVRPRHAWDRYFWLWETFFAILGVTTVVFVLLEGRGAHPWPAARPVAVALVIALAGWYTGYGRRLHSGPPDRRRVLIYQLGVFALYAPAVLLNGAAELALFALVPQVFMLWPMLPAALIAVALYATAWAAALLRGLPRAVAQRLPELVLGLGLTLLLSLVLSIYIQRISQQSAERAELIEALDASRAQVARLSHEAGVAAERQRLAGDIHDTVAQGLSSVVMLVQAAQAEVETDPATARHHLALAQRTARENLAETRALVAALTPAPLAGATLPDALTRLAAGAATATTLRVEGEPRALPTAVEVVLLRAAQESLTNVAKHAGAARVRLLLRYAPGAVTLEVTDDGCGFTPPASPGGYGLAGMRVRAEQIGATLTVESTLGTGTTARVRVEA